jgi:hypothetical protein
MNPEPNILEVSNSANPENANPSPDDPQMQETTDPVHPAFGTGRRGNGYVARLPKVIRDQINILIRDGVQYAEIIERVGEPAKHLQPSHIKEWKKYGYQDWLLEREWLDRLSSKAEFSTDVLAAPNTSNLHDAGLRIAASQMFDQLMRFNAAAETGASDQPEKFARLVNALSRLNREALAFQKYRDTLAKNTAELKKLDPDRDLDDNELVLLVNRMDKTFKIPRPNLDQLLAQAALRDHESKQRIAVASGVLHVASGVPPDVEPGVPPGGSSAHMPPTPATLPGAQDSDRAASPSSIPNPPPSPSLSIDPPILESNNPSLIDSALRTPNSALEPSINPIPGPASDIANQNSKIENPREFCPECKVLLRPRLPTGERPSPHCHVHGCGSPVRPRNAPFEPCPHCGVTVPDLLPNGRRAGPNCHECKKPLPPPDQVPLLAGYLASLTTPAAHEL